MEKPTAPLTSPFSVIKSVIFTVFNTFTFLDFFTALASIGLKFSPFILIFLFPRLTYSPFLSFKITSPNFSTSAVISLNLFAAVKTKSFLTIPFASFIV